MDRPRRRWIRSLLIVASGAVGAFVALGIPANAAGPVNGTVVAWDGLTLRAGPGTWADKHGILQNGTGVVIACQVTGERIAGNTRTTDRWDQLTNGWYVSDAFIERSEPIGVCTGSGRHEGSAFPPVTGGSAVGAWNAPVPYKGAPGFRTAERPDHDGVDLAAPRGTPIRAAAAGTVITVQCNTSEQSCDVDGSAQVRGCGWYLEIRHTGDIVTRYCHLLRRPSVAVGQWVEAGQVVGAVGTSGNSSGPHLHFEVHTGAPATRGNAVDPADFMRRANAAIT